MSTKYKFQNHQSGVYFISFAVVDWIDVFVREVYRNEIIASLKYCRENKGLILYAWVIMPSHLHLIGESRERPLSETLRDFKKFTSKKIVQLISENKEESRKEWMLELFERAGRKNSNVSKYQFWRQDNHPVEIWSKEVIEQKLFYLHNNPVAGGFVKEAADWLYSSAVDYSGEKGMLEVTMIV